MPAQTASRGRQPIDSRYLVKLRALRTKDQEGPVFQALSVASGSARQLIANAPGSRGERKGTELRARSTLASVTMGHGGRNSKRVIRSSLLLRVGVHADVCG